MIQFLLIQERKRNSAKEKKDNNSVAIIYC